MLSFSSLRICVPWCFLRIPVFLFTAAVTDAVIVPVHWIGFVDNWNDIANWDTGQVPDNGADSFEVTIDSAGAGTDSVSLDIHAEVDRINLGIGDQLIINNNRSLTFSAGGPATSLVNDGTVLLDSLGNTTTVTFGTDTIAGDGEIVLSNNTQNRFLAPGAVVTNGSNHTIRGAGQLLANGGGMLNLGTVRADQTLELIVDPSILGFTNQGTLEATGSGGLRLAAGDYTNAGADITAHIGSQVILNSGVEIIGGDLVSLGSGQIKTSTGSATVDGITLNGGLDVLNNSQLILENGLENNGTLRLLSLGNATTLNFSGSQTLSGIGNVTLNNNTQNRILSSGAVLTHAPGHSISGSGQILANTGGMINQGSLIANQPIALIIDPDGLGFTNLGTLSATGAGGLQFNAGVFTNTGNTISVATGSKLSLSGNVDIVGGILSTSGTGNIIVAIDTPSLDAVTVNGQLRLPNTHTIEVLNGLTLNGTLTLESLGNQTDFKVLGSETIDGSGTIQLSNNSQNRVLTNDSIVTLGSEQTLRGAGQILANTGGMILQGTILAEGSIPLTIDPNAKGFVNSGTLTAAGTGGLILNAGHYTNTGRSITVQDTSVLNVHNDTHILEGIVQTLGSGTVVVATNTPIFDALTFIGNLRLPNARDIEIINGLTLNGTIQLESVGNQTDLNILGPETIDGSGTIQLSNNSQNRILTNDAVVTLGANQTIRGAGQILANTGGLHHLGTILAEGSVALTIDPNAQGFLNQGTLRAVGSGGLVFRNGVFTNTGHTIEVENASRLSLNTGVHIVGGTLQTSGTGEVLIASDTPILESVALNGTLRMPNARNLQLSHSLTNNGTIRMDSIGNLTDMIFDGSQNLGGTGTVTMSNNTQNRMLTDGTVLTHGANHTIRGAGQILANSGGMINAGTILAEGTNALTINPDANAFTNSGTLQAVGSGGLTFLAGDFNNWSHTISIGDGSKLSLNTGTVINGGTLSAAGSGFINTASSTPVLNQIVLQANLVLANTRSVLIRNGISNNDTINLNSIGNITDLVFEAAPLQAAQGVPSGTIGGVLDGIGEIVMTNNTQNRVYSSDGTIIQLRRHTIRGAGQLLANQGGMINLGTIIAEGTNALTIDPSALGFSNQGSLRASGSGGLVFGAGEFHNKSYATLEIEAGSKLLLQSGSILIGGTLRTLGTGYAEVASDSPVLNGITLDGEVRLPNSRKLQLENGITNNGTIRLNSIGNATNLVIAGTQTIAGSGQIVLSNNLNNRILPTGGIFIQDTHHTIRGAGKMLVNSGGMLNRGTIHANQTSAITIDPDANGFVNEGSMIVSNTGGITLAAGTSTNAPSGTIAGIGRVHLQAATFTNNGTFDPGFSAGTLELVGDVPFGPTADLQIEIGGTTQGTEYDLLDITGTGLVSLGGTLSVSLIDGFMPSPADTFTILQTTGSITAGMFTNTLGNRVTAGSGSFLVSYNPDNVILTDFDGLVVIPEPRTFALASGLLFLLMLGIRRRR